MKPKSIDSPPVVKLRSTAARPIRAPSNAGHKSAVASAIGTAAPIARLAAVQSLARSRARYQSDTGPVIEEMRDTLKDIEDATGVDPTDVARVREQILESRRMEIQAELEYQLALIGLEAVVGMPLESIPVNRARRPAP